MKKKVINSQLTNVRTYYHVRCELINLAENVFVFKNLPDIIDDSYVNDCLFKNGSIAWFYDDELKSVVALPYSILGNLDIYGRPMSIMARARNGRYYRKLSQDEFIIMYDNTAKISLLPDVCMRAERISLCIRTSDINLVHQRTPRVWKTSKDKERTIRDMMGEVDAMEENISTYDSIDIDDIGVVMAPAPFVVDKIDIHLEKEYASFYQLVGIASVKEQKRERLITDEMKASLGGTIASRFSRYNPRRKAVDLINKKWGLNIEVGYYDGFPESESDINDLSNISTT